MISDSLKIKMKQAKCRISQSMMDLLVLVAGTVLVLELSYFFNVFGVIVRFLRENPDKIIYVDEIITTLLTLSVGLAIFSWRRWRELKRETAKRIKKQEELLSVTATQAEVERIISKQLRADMDQMKQDVREILHFVSRHR